MGRPENRRQLVWEEIDSSSGEEGLFRLDWKVYRTKVVGGWLVLVVQSTSGLTFYPDPEHKWDGANLP